MKSSATLFLLLSLSFATTVACGNSTPVAKEPAEPTTTAAPTPKPEPKPEPTADPTPPSTPPTPEAEPVAEKCDAGWVCVKVSFDTRKVEKRDTKLIGDPKIESTWSKTSDGRTVTFEQFSKGAVDVTLRRKPSDKNEVVVKAPKGGGEIVIDHHDGSVDDFTHVGIIAAEQGGALLIDLRYMK